MQSFIRGLAGGKPDDIYKIAYLSDCHYDPTVASPAHLLNRANVLTYLSNFVLAMESYRPNIIIHAGDKTGASSSNATTQQAWYQATIDAVAESRFDVYDGVSPANHDFEYMSFAQVKAKHASETWMESGTMYGYWEHGGFGWISLDAQYDTNDDSHLENTHVGYGHINQAQLDWLEAKLASVSVPCIVNVHQIAAEFDTDLFYLTKPIYHIDNRTDLRSILEESGKVICVIHGHLHFNRADIINGIPYITCPALVPLGQDPIDEPETGLGEWLTVEVNKTRKTLTVANHTYIDGIDKKMYEQTYNWGAFAPVKNPLRVVNPVQFSNVLNKRLKVKGFPSNLILGDPRPTDTTMRIVGVATAGQEIWEHESQAGIFTYTLAIRLADNAVRAIRTSAASNAVHIIFESDGDISAYNGAALTAISSYSVDTWYEVEIAVDVASETFSIAIDGVEVATDFAFRASAASIGALMIETDTGEMFIDSLAIA